MNASTVALSARVAPNGVSSAFEYGRTIVNTANSADVARASASL